MTINTLADRYAAAKAVLDAAQDEVNALKAEIIALGTEEVEGARSIVKVGLGERTTLDGKAVADELGAAWVKAHSKTSVYEILRIKAKPMKTLVAEAVAELRA